MDRPHSLRFSSPGLLVAGLLLACGGSSPASTETGTDATTDPTTEVSTSTTAPTTAEPTTVAPTEGTTVEPDTTSTTTNAAPTSTTTEACRAECGDGVVACDEECDDGADNNDFLQGACRTDCTAARCGDGVVDYLAGEECDDLGVGAGCSATCQIEAPVTCGDGQLDLDQGEECDDANLDPGDGCSPACQLEPLGLTCGDGTVDLLEECDDANLDNGDGCNPTCNLANDTSLFVGSPGNLGLVDGVGVGARISGTGGLAVDSHYLYLADAQNNCIRRIDIATAAVETIAGSTMGQSGYADDPVGLNARFAGLDAIATDGKTLWVTDNMNRRLRAVSLTPPYAVTTVAGSGAIGVDDGVGDAASFDDTRGLTYYAGHVYMVDASAAVLRRFDPATQEVLTLAGQAYVGGVADGIGDAAQFVSPRYLASDNSGVLYIADTNGYHIRSFNTVTGYVGTLAGNGVAGYIDGVGLDASIHRPRGLASDGTSLYFGEFEQHTVRQVVVATGAVSTNAGQHCGGEPCQGGYVEGVGVAARFHGPFALAFHPGSNSLFILDSANRVIRRMQ
jgi:cysteine-rich repeat protein